MQDNMLYGILLNGRVGPKLKIEGKLEQVPKEITSPNSKLPTCSTQRNQAN
uniref:Uncharacterized protein n=1 Tax=Arundo donax TaxID=35708 RepID=A0A0A9C475_ARUDO